MIMENNSAYILWHTRDPDAEDEDSKLIGVYSSRDLAEAARTRASKLPGFCNQPDGFIIEPYPIDKDHWTEGFVDLTSEDN